MSVPLLCRYVNRRIQRPGDGMTCPAMLVQELAVNHMEVDATTVTDGQCGLHGFFISLYDARHRWPTLTHLCAWKSVMTLRPLQAKLSYLRDIAVRWLQKHSNEQLWDYMTVRNFVISSMSDDIHSFGDYLEKMSRQHFWIDASVLHALGTIFKVDVMLFQAGSDVAFVGENLGQHEPASCVPMIPLALANDRHYWGVVMTHSHSVPDVAVSYTHLTLPTILLV